MTDLLLSLAEINITMSAVILFVMLLGAILGKKYTARCRYIVWVIVLARLCIPIGTQFFPAAVEVEIPLERGEKIVQTENVPEPETVVYPLEPPVNVIPESGDSYSTGSGTVISDTVTDDEPVSIKILQSVHDVSAANMILRVIGIVWTVGAAVTFS